MRVGLAKIIWLDGHPDTERHWQDAPQEVIDYWLGVADKYLTYLHSQGVVIENKDEAIFHHGYFPLIEPLIEEGK